MHVAFNGPTSTAFPWTNAATVTPMFSGCTAVGPGFVMSCSPAELRASGYSGGTTFGTAGGGVTSGSVTNIDCEISVGPVPCGTLTGTVNMHYINAGSAGGAVTGNARLTITATGQALYLVASGCAVFPTGTATFGSPGATGTTINDLTYTIDGPNAPYIYRTP